MNKKIALFLVFFFSFSLVQAAFLRNIPRQLVQPNGDTLHCFISGDEFYNYLHDADGYTIIQDINTGYFVYAKRSGDEILPTSYIAGKTNPVSVNLVPNTTISAQEWRKRRDMMLNAVPQIPQAKSSGRNRGHINNLVISIRFNGDAELETPFSTLESMFNDSTTAITNSMYNYFKAASYQQLSIVSFFYPEPENNVTLSYEDIYTRDYYIPYSATNPIGYADDSERGEREFQLLARAVEYVKDSIPADLELDYDGDGRVDNICFVIKGTVGDWSDLLWPHRWSLYGEDVYIRDLRVWDFNFQLESSPAYFNNSVLCHEMFHTLGAPDLYHYYDYTEISTVGKWDLMERNTTPPQHSGAYMKLKYGNWIDSIPEITESGTYSLRPIGSATPENLAYKISSSNPDQFFVVEYRDNTLDFETGIPGSGLLIYRIDTRFNGNASFNNYNVFDEVYLFKPGGQHLVNGNSDIAHFGTHVGRSAFNSSTNPYPFLTQGLRDILNISEITIQGDSLVFTYNNTPELHLSVDRLVLPGQSGGSDIFQIISNVPWQISGGNQGWISWYPNSGSGSQRVEIYTTSANPNETARIDTLIISSPGLPDQMIRIFQSDAIFSISDTTLYFNSEEGTQQVEIMSDAFWRFFDIPSWVTISPTYGMTTGSPSIHVSSHSSSEPRTALLRIYSEEKNIYLKIIQWGSSDVASFDSPRLSVYPNPMQTVLYIKQQNNSSQIAQVQIFDISGKQIYRETISDTSAALSVEHLSPGIYLLQVSWDDGKTESIKLVKE